MLRLHHLQKTPFRVYMPSKPGKYGLKIFSINDVSTSYMFNAIPYVGVSKSEIEKKEQFGSRSKKQAAEPPQKEKNMKIFLKLEPQITTLPN